MKAGFYAGIARSNIKKNYRFFIPRILCESGLCACFYIALTLTSDKRLSEIRGGEYVPTFMGMGTVILALLSLILMLYTNSFLMKQRKNEFGLYNILGMEKKHVGRVLFHESFLTGLVSVLLGLGLGILFYKLCSLLICRLLQSDIILGFYFIRGTSLYLTAALFVLIDGFVYFINRIGISRMNPVDLLASRHTGEREPRVKWLMLVIGVLSLGGGYCIALTIKQPLAAIGMFFVAILLVILGTYFLFVTGSTFVLKALRRNKKYYYDKRHMPAVSGLIHRMKQNAVGLASITVLCTGVLIMISATVSLYSGLQGTLDSHYPQHLYLSGNYCTKDGKSTPLDTEDLRNIAVRVSKKHGAEIKDIRECRFLEVTWLLKDGRLYSAGKGFPAASVIPDITDFTFITEETYRELTGITLGLHDNEIAVSRISSSIEGLEGISDRLTIGDREYAVVSRPESFPIGRNSNISGIVNCYGVIVSDDAVLDSVYAFQKEEYEDNASDYNGRIGVEYENISEVIPFGDAIWADVEAELDALGSKLADDANTFYYMIDSYWETRESIIGMYGTLLFLGILLGAVCLFATVLIIYYKQISEGYEDRDRFRIMQNLGMSRREVHKTINSQVLLVFFLPLGVSCIHFAFAFPMLTRLLRLLMLYKDSLMIICSVVTIAVFALVYTLIYKGTSRTYYKIVR